MCLRPTTGGIVGVHNYNSLTISNCAIDDFLVVNNDKETLFDSGVGGFVGWQSGASGATNITIENCLLNNFRITENQTYRKNKQVYKPGHQAANSTFTIKNCVINSLVTSLGTGVNGTINETNVITSKDITTGLSCSSVSGEYNSSATDGTQSIWYYASDYNSGYPYLRQFIQWQTYYFYAGLHGTVSASEITIPTDVAIEYTTTTDTNDTISVCGNQVVAVADEGYTFNVWTELSSGSKIEWRASFVAKTYRLTFKYNENATFGIWGEETFTRDYSLPSVGYNCYLGLHVGSTNIYITLSGETQVIYYSFSKKYYLEEIYFNGEKCGTDEQIVLYVAGDSELSIEIILKTYGTEFN